MPFNPTNLLLSLAYAMAQAAPGSPSITLGGNLFVHQLPASASNDVGAVLRVYGGPIENELRPVPVVSVQCMTYAPGDDAGAGLLFAQQLYDALHDTSVGASGGGGPRTHWTLVGKKLDDATGNVIDDDAVTTWDVRLIVLTSGPPGIVGRGDAASGGGGRYEISFNFDVRLTDPQT
jgi:hypothetical protein